MLGEQRRVSKEDAALGQEVQGGALGRGSEKFLLCFKPQPVYLMCQVPPGRGGCSSGAHALAPHSQVVSVVITL